jgi:hypothetical protein
MFIPCSPPDFSVTTCEDLLSINLDLLRNVTGTQAKNKYSTQPKLASRLIRGVRYSCQQRRQVLKLQVGRCSLLSFDGIELDRSSIEMFTALQEERSG